MYESNLRLVPWRCKEEWEEVYSNAYSEDPIRKKKACDVMELWLLLRSDVPGGVECTLALLKVTLRAAEEDSLPKSELALMYSTAILRVINTVCEGVRTGKGKDRRSLFEMAEQAMLPAWLIELRHDIAHSSTLPPLSLLTMAANLLLSWLAEHYWRVEKEELQDVIIPKSREELTMENVTFYLDYYTDLMLWHKKQATRLNQIIDQNVLKRSEEVSSHRIAECERSCLPWLPANPKHKPEAKLKLKCPLKKALSHCCNFLGEYVMTPLYSTQTLHLIVQRMKRDFSIHGLHMQFWKPLIQKLNSWEMLDRLMVEISSSYCQEQKYEKNFAGCWLKQLALAVMKKSAVEEMKEALSRPEREISDPRERRLLRKALLKKRLNMENIEDKDLNRALFNLVEQRMSHRLNKSVRLVSPVTYLNQSCAFRQVILNCAEYPDSNTVSTLDCLFNLMNPPYQPEKEIEIKRLVNVFLGKKRAFCKESNKESTEKIEFLFTSKDLVDSIKKDSNRLIDLDLDDNSQPCEPNRTASKSSDLPCMILPIVI